MRVLLISLMLIWSLVGLFALVTIPKFYKSMECNQNVKPSIPRIIS